MTPLPRPVPAIILALIALCSNPAAADEAAEGTAAKRVEMLVMQSLRGQLEQSQNLAYSEAVTFGAKRRRFDWVLASFPNGDWSVFAKLTTHDGGTANHLYIRRGADRFVGKVEPNLDWAAVIEDHSREGLYWHSPTASRWFPVDAARVDERLRQWDAVDSEIGDDHVAFTVPANTSVVDALNDSKASMHGLFGYRFEFRKTADLYVLSRCDILQVARDRSGDESEGVQCLDDWRRTIAGYQVCRSHSRVWFDFRLVGSHVLPMKWEYRFPEGTATGEVLAETIQQLSQEELETRLVLRVPDAWTGRGILRDRRTGEVVASRGGSMGLSEAKAPPAPNEYTRKRHSERRGVSNEFVVLLVGGGLLAALALFVAARHRRRRQV